MSVAMTSNTLKITHLDLATEETEDDWSQLGAMNAEAWALSWDGPGASTKSSPVHM